MGKAGESSRKILRDFIVRGRLFKSGREGTEIKNIVLCQFQGSRSWGQRREGEFTEADIKDAGREITGAEREIEHDLGGGQRNAQGVDDDQAGKDPKQVAAEAAGFGGQSGEKQAVHQAHGEDDPGHEPVREAPQHQQGSGDRVENEVKNEKTLERFQHDFLG